MRMWMIDPKLLCRKHLLGEHSELHKFIPSFKKRTSVTGRLGHIELSKYKERHDELAEEMLNRGYKHQSPLESPDFSYLPEAHYEATVNKDESLKELCKRCIECRKNINKALNNSK